MYSFLIWPEANSLANVFANAEERGKIMRPEVSLSSLLTAAWKVENSGVRPREDNRPTVNMLETEVVLEYLD